MEFEAPPPGEELAQRRALRAATAKPTLSDAARSLVADFAGARGDIAERRRRGEASVRACPSRPASAACRRRCTLVDAAPDDALPRGTLRGGQALHHAGNIVVVGDVNPGAELVATGDILVFGRLAGIAHAGAQRRRERPRLRARARTRRSCASPTFIACGRGRRATRPRVKPEAAVAQDGRIVVLPLERLGDVAKRGAPTA